MTLYFVKCDLDDSTEDRTKDYQALTCIFEKGEGGDQMVVEMPFSGENAFKATSVSTKKMISGFEVARGCWIAEFKGGGDYLGASIKKSSNAIRQNDKLIIVKIRPQNVIMQHPNKNAIYDWMHKGKEETRD